MSKAWLLRRATLGSSLLGGTLAASAAPPGALSHGGQVKLEDLLGRRVRYQGDEGRVAEGHADDTQASVTVNLRATCGAPRRVVTVPEPEWHESSCSTKECPAVPSPLAGAAGASSRRLYQTEHGLHERFTAHL